MLAVVACGSGSPGSTAVQPTPAAVISEATIPPTSTSAVPAVPATPADAGLAPDFSFTLFQGEEVIGAGNLTLFQLRGKPLVLNFWARLCPPCWSEMPELQEFYEEYQDQVVLLGIDIGQFTGLGSPKDAGKLLQSMGITYPAGSTDDGEVVHKFKVLAMPTTVFITGKGEVFRKWTGALDGSTVTRLVKEMLGQESSS